MSIPLDLLYDFIESYVNHDVIIYRWLPHGSKNLEDLTPLRVYQRPDHDSRPVMVCHDQEPLDWDLHNSRANHEFVQRDFHDYWQVPTSPVAWPWGQDQVLQSWIEPNEIRTTNARMVLLHSEHHSQSVLRARELGWYPVYVWSHGIIARDWFRYAQHDPDLLATRQHHRHFLIYSRAWTGSREYRLWFLDQLYQNDLQSVCTVKFSDKDDGHAFQDHVFRDHQWHCRPSWSSRVFDANDAPSWASATYNSQEYAQHDIEIVLETVVDRLHLTEKTCRALACAQPFVLVAGTGSLAYLRGLGFKTFDPWINEAYDQEPNAQRRLIMILQEMRRIANLDSSDLAALRRALRTVAQHNRSHFFSEQLHQNIMREFLDQWQIVHQQVQAQGQSLPWQDYLRQCYPGIVNRLGTA